MEHRINIVKAKESDLEAIQEMAYQIWPVYYSNIISIEQIEYMLRLLYSPEALMQQGAKGQIFFIAEEKGKMVGFMGITPGPSNKMKIDKLYLNESCRGKGYGKLLIQFAEEQAKQLKASSIFLNVNRFNASFDFYTKMGFEVKNIIDIPFGPFWLNDFVVEKGV
jgi:N-acetylglutamate synthase-like GNAT family acetyltransferase